MNIIDNAYELFSGIKEKKYSFSNAINKKINTLGMSAMDIVIVKDTLKSVVNRYYFLKSEVKELVPSDNQRDIDVLVIALGLARYARNVNVNDVIEFLNDSDNASEYSFDMDKVEELFNKIAKNPTPVPEKLENNFVKKIALLYSYPEWIVGMMKKHFGTKNTFKTISDSRKGAPINICVNTLKMEDPLPEGFEKTDAASTSYIYTAKQPLVENALFKQRKIFVMDQMEQALADILEINQMDEVLLIGGNHSHLAALASIKANDLAKINYAAPNEDYFMAATKLKEAFGLKSCDVFNEKANMVVTHVAYNSQDKVLVTPLNSELGLIRQKPEILLTFKQNELDGLLAGQKEDILEASKFVKEGGMLVYSVPTLNMKESFAIVNEFLQKNTDFDLVDEKLIFPYVNRTNGMYYAKMIKKVKEVTEE